MCKITSKVRLISTTILCGAVATLLAPVAHAQEKAKSSDEIVEVIVTAQKRTEKLKDIAVSASVVDTSALTKSNATDISDLNKIVPSVQLKGSFNGRVPMAMRGVSTSANEGTVGLTSGVAVLIDGVPTSSDSMAANQLSDIARVEVLKGPQSTLGGRAASAGVINIVTRRPSQVAGGDVSVMGTDDNQQRAEMFVTGPMGDKVAGSLSAYGDHTQYPMQNLATGKYTATNSAGVRGKVLIQPTEDLDIMLSARSSYMYSSGNNFVYNYVTPGATIFGIDAPFLSQDVLLAGYDPTDFKNTKYNSISGARSRIHDNDVSLNVDWKVGEYTLSSTTAVQHETQYNKQDVPIVATYFFDNLLLANGVPQAVIDAALHFGNYQEITNDIQTASQEFKIASPVDRRFNFVAGLFWSDTKVVSDNNRTWVANPLINTETSDVKTLGLYGRGTYSLTDDWKLITGLRFNWDNVSYIIDQTANNAAGAFYSAGSHKATTTVGDITLQKKFGANSQAYLTYSRGYKPFAYNTAQQLTSDATLDPVNPETINHFELGTKGSYFDRKVTFDASLFHTQYKNYQIQVFDTGAAWPTPLILSNAAEAQTEGLEIDTSWRAAQGLTFNLSAAFIDAKFLSYTGAPCYNSQTTATGCITVYDTDGTTVLSQGQDLSGKPMPDSPKTKFTLGFDKRFDMASGPFDYDFSGTYAWRAKANMQANQNPETVQDAFGILNLSLTAHSKVNDYAITLFVNNVTDQYYVTNLEDFFAGIWGTNNAVIAQPARDYHRYVGVRLSKSF
ncbi:MAG: TonB-dependent receptor [Asticcacaulis sp.]|uniref:TonB-dependent receptor n=1 Tax=Asticcacaulis sp. TaxID=1872648 RepID=UPI0039E5B68D